MKSIGLMSGTSLDGLDICYVDFSFKNEKWQFNILKTKSLEYADSWSQKLRDSFLNNSVKGSLIDLEYGEYLGEQVNKFISEIYWQFLAFS